MKKIVFTLFLVCGSMLCLANPVSEKMARQVAYNFLKKKASVSYDELNLLYAQLFPKGEDTAYYVYTAGGSSFVIVAGDDIAQPVWAYSVDNGFGKYLPENVKSFLDDLVNELQFAKKYGVRSDESTQRIWVDLTDGVAMDIASKSVNPELWANVLSDNQILQSTTGGAVAPLVTTHWRQDSPYNNLCPLLSNGISHSAVGCGAVAVAQILRYWQYPENPRGMHINPTNAMTLQIDFDTVTFDYTLMPNTITTGSMNVEKYEVARLLYYCGVAMDMIYGSDDSVSGSAAKYFAPLTSLVSFFRYSENIGLARKVDYSDSVWYDMLQTELALGHPFIYRGGGSNSNHIFICDGFDESNMFHFNMGHGGWDDGYYLLSSISMAGQLFNYSSSQLAILGIVPDSANHTVTAQKHGFSRFIVNDTLDVYRQRTLINRNGYQFYNMESDRNNHTMVFTSGDMTKRLKIEALNVSGYGDVRIYDGDNMDSLIDGNGGYLHSNQYPKYSTRNAIVIRDSAGLSSHDYAFRLTLECSKVSDIGYSISGDTINLFWNENGGASNWQVEYGITGFHHGEGTLIDTDAPMCSIVGLTGNRQYEFYVRTVCGGSSYSEWEMIRFVVPPTGGIVKWTEVVTSQPEGYQIGSDGNIYISTSEGLAWLISTRNGLNGQSSYGVYNMSVYLMSDVDMSAYQWTPIQSLKRFDGRNHTIKGLVISDTLSDFHMDIGFVESVHDGDSVMNTVFKDCIIQCGNAHYVGCVAGVCNGAIMNCGATGIIISSGSTIGGLTGSLFSGKLINCYSDVDVSGYNEVGGAIGSNGNDSYFQSQITNCYSSGIVTGSYPYSNSSIGVFIGKANRENNTDYLAYWYQRDTTAVGSGNNVAGFSPFVLGEEIDTIITMTDSWGNVLGYRTIYDTVWSLVSPATIAGQNVSTLVDALNAWVDSNNTDGKYRRWTTDIDNINQGFPVFDETRYTLSLHSDTSMGTVVGGGRYVEGSETTISANANNCYHFTQWSDGNTSTTRTVTMSQDVSLTAYFAPDAAAVGNVAVAECDQYVWKGGTYTTSGVYSFDTLTMAGCDSTVALALTINHSDLTGGMDITACNSYTWHGTTYYNSGVYTYNTTTTMGCDSLVTLNLTMGNEVITNESAVACDEYLWKDVIYNGSGVYADTTLTVHGCDSIVMLYLTVNHSDTMMFDTILACDSYAWEGNTYNESGVYTFDTLTTAGCDSVVTLFLTINYSDLTGTDNMTVCDDNYTWHGTTYYNSGVYTYNTTTTMGCDSLVTLNLTIGDVITTSEDTTVCDSYAWNGAIYVNSGTYTYSTTSMSGCDSIVTLELVINHPINTSTTEVTCDSAEWMNETYFVGGTYLRTAVDTNECIQTDTLYLTLHYSSSPTYLDMFFEDSALPYNYEGVVITGAGDYTIPLTNADGCDSIVYLHAIVEHVGIEIVDGVNDIVVSPNPTEGKVTVRYNQSISAIEIYDVLGRKVGTETNANDLDLSDLPNGVYTIRIVVPQGQQIRKIIKQ